MCERVICLNTKVNARRATELTGNRKFQEHTHTHIFTKKNSHSACKRSRQRSDYVLSFVHSSTHLSTHSLYAPDAPTHRQSVKDKAKHQTIITNNHNERVIRQDREGAGGAQRKEGGRKQGD